MAAGEIAAAVEAATNLAKVGIGIGQGIKANNLAKRLVPVKYNIQQPVIDNQRLAERDASQGMSDAARTAYANSADRGMTTGIDAILRGAGNINSFSHFYDNYANDFESVAKLDDELRSRNKATLMNQNQLYADALDKQWQINDYKPFEDQRAYIAGLRGMGTKNITGGIDGIGSAAMHYLQAGMYNDDGNLNGSAPHDMPDISGSTGYGQTKGITPSVNTSSYYRSSTPFSDAAGLSK